MSYLDEIPKELLEEICLLLPVDDIRNINSMDLLFKIGLDEVFWIRYYRNRQYSFIRRYQNLFDFYSSQFNSIEHMVNDGESKLNTRENLIPIKLLHVNNIINYELTDLIDKFSLMNKKYLLKPSDVTMSKFIKMDNLVFEFVIRLNRLDIDITSIKEISDEFPYSQILPVNDLMYHIWSFGLIKVTQHQYNVMLVLFSKTNN